MIKYLLLVLFSFSAFGSDLDLFKQMKQSEDELCVYNPDSQIDQISKIALKYKGYCKDYTQDTFFNAQMGCFKGIGKGTKEAVTSFADFLKFVLIDNPVYGVYKAAFHEIGKIVTGDFSPSDLANQYANMNIRSQADIWNLSKKYFEQFKQFSVDFKNELMTQIKDFPCLPVEKQNEIICRGATDVFFLVLSPEKFVKGAVWGYETMGALRKFIVETKNVQGLQNMSLADRLGHATKALKEVKNSKELMKLRNGTLTEEILPNGDKIINYEYISKGADGKLHKIKREVAVDVNTGAIDANKGIGKLVIEEIVKSQQGAGTAIFIDVNHLGKANYFAGSADDIVKAGTQGGDMYLAQTAEEIRKNLRPGDMLFKKGGDEFVVILGSNNPKVVKDASQRMINSIDQNKDIKRFFKLQVTNITEKYREVNKATKVADLSPAFVKSLSPEQLASATKNFAQFKQTILPVIKAELQEQASYRGSISIGGSTIKHGDNIEAVLERAEAQAKEVKAAYKTKYGHDVSKYKAEGDLDFGTRRYGPAEAMEPN